MQSFGFADSGQKAPPQPNPNPNSDPTKNNKDGQPPGPKPKPKQENKNKNGQKNQKEKDKEKDKEKETDPHHPYQEDDASSNIQKPAGKQSAGFCYIGEDRGYRSCSKVTESDTCVSGDIFPTMEKCINPKLR